MVEQSIKSASFRLVITYQQLWDAFRKINRGQAEFRPKSNSFLFEIDPLDNVHLFTHPAKPLTIIGWPSRYSEDTGWSRDRLNIYITLWQLMRINPTDAQAHLFTIEQSHIEVSYSIYDPKVPKDQIADERELLQRVMYDSTISQMNHPIFHGHVLKYNQIRIATPPMDLRAVLFSLVADHVPPNLRDLVIERTWNRCIPRLPLMPCDRIRDRMGDGRLDNIHWYNLPFEL